MLPDSVAKRDLLWAKHKSPPDYSRYGTEFQGEGWLTDAAEFFARAGKKDKLQEIGKTAIREGDAALLARIAAWAPELVQAEQWRECAMEAQRLRKYSFERQAWEKAGDTVKAAEASDNVLKALGYTVMKAPPPNEANPPGTGQLA